MSAAACQNLIRFAHVLFVVCQIGDHVHVHQLFRERVHRLLRVRHHACTPVVCDPAAISEEGMTSTSAFQMPARHSPLSTTSTAVRQQVQQAVLSQERWSDKCQATTFHT